MEITEDTPIEEIDYSALPFCAVDPDEVIEYVPPMAQKYPEKIQPVFLVTVMTAKQAAKLQDKVMKMEVNGKKKGNQVMFSSAAVAYEALTTGNLKGWRNVTSRSGKIVEFDESISIEKNLKVLNGRTVLEVGEFVISGKDLGGQEKED